MKIKYKPWAKGLLYLVEAGVIILSVFPILWVIMSSFKTNGEILSSPLALPAYFSLDTYIDIFQKYSFPTYFFNSLLAAGVSTLVSLLFYAMGAYVIAKFEFPGRKLLFALFTITLLVPSHSKTQPIFSLIMKMNLYDSIWGVTLVYLSAGMAMSIFVLKAGFMAIPKSLDEAAALDGASFFRTFWTINLPLAKSALATAGILMFLGLSKGQAAHMDMKAAGPRLMAGVAQIHGSLADLLPGHLPELVVQGHGMGDDLKAIVQGAVVLAIDAALTGIIGESQNLRGILRVLAALVNFLIGVFYLSLIHI